MRIVLLNVDGKGGVNKDTAGGYGTRFSVGKSIFAKIIERSKKLKFPEVSLAYLAAIFMNAGHEVNFLENKLPNNGTDLVIIPSSIVDCYPEVEMARRIKENDNSIKIGFIRPFAAVQPEMYLKYGDFIIKGEPESAAIKIAETEDIPNGTVDSPPILDQESIPFPNWDKFPISEYSYAPNLKKKPFLPVLSSRGCPYTCTYCPYPVEWKWRKPRSPEHVVAELKYLVERYGIKSFQFRDPTFTLQMERAQKIAELMIKEGLDLEWGCETRLDRLSVDLLDLLHESGLRSIEVGVESADVNILKSVKRLPTPIQHQEEIKKHCDKLGIKMSAFYVLGLPWDTKETIKNTIEYSKRLNSFVAQFHINTPYPGTENFEILKDKIDDTNWEHYTGFLPVFKHDNLTKEELLKFKEHAFVSYYFRLQWLFKYLRHIIFP